MSATTSGRSGRASIESLERRMLLSGNLDTSFDSDGIAAGFPGGAIAVTDMAVQADGRVIVVGYQNKVATAGRLTPSGAIDSSFGAGGIVSLPQFADLDAVAIGADGNIALGGRRIEGTDIYLYMRFLSPTGTLLSNTVRWGGGYLTVKDIVPMSDGRYVLGGSFSDAGFFGGNADMMVARIRANGTPDTTFDGDGRRPVGFGGEEYGSAIAIDYTGTAATNPRYGSIVIAGSTKDEFSRPAWGVARLTPTGAYDNTFGDRGRMVIYRASKGQASGATDLLIQSTGRIIVTGRVPMDAATGNDFAVIGLTPAGVPDPTFGTRADGRLRINLGGDDRSYTLGTSNSGGILVGGQSGGAAALHHLTVNGYPTTDLGPAGYRKYSNVVGAITDIERYSSHRLVIGTNNLVYDGGTGRVARILETGANTVRLTSLDTRMDEADNLPDGSVNPASRASFIVYRSERLATPTRVWIGYSGTATTGSKADPLDLDFVGLPAGRLGYSVTIAGGQTYAAVYLTAINDARPETDEVARFTVLPDAAYDVGTPSSVAITIYDNDRVSLRPVADATVFSNAPTTNFGLTSQITARTVSGDQRLSFLRFNIGSLTTFNNVRLRLYGNLSNTLAQNVDVAAYASSNTTWSETGITWATKPAVGTTVLARASVLTTQSEWYEWDLTNYIRSQRTLGRSLVTIVLKATVPVSPIVRFNSDEAATDRPMLAVF